ncbi:hypothetical protein G9C85_17870 [Halorubellus sp. JP-L1]|uniref:hypothetical protein n=1 Tax=Halorubellus sp. JP-L1 TaxID=2715753 RepID=UPI00140910FB|nr:hypothetical protein [Halorubellus sp. JP-L1]NHN43489.1 hypothetical protein [Halorubellus sp. JP-L1]
MARRHPLDDAAVERAAADHDCPPDRLHALLEAFDEITSPRLDNLVENTETEYRPDRTVVDRGPERLTLAVDTATFRLPFMQLDWDEHTTAMGDDVDREAARSTLQDAVVDAHRTHGVERGLDPETAGMLPLTTWTPRIYDLEAGGMSRQEARAHVLRDGGLTQKQVRDRMDLPSTSAAKNALHRGDRKVRTARRLVDAVDRDDEIA